MKRKICSLLLSSVMTLSLLAGCSGQSVSIELQNDNEEKADDEVETSNDTDSESETESINLKNVKYLDTSCFMDCFNLKKSFYKA